MLIVPAAFAVGFGDVRVLSALNEPLRAEIPLLDSSELEAEEIQVRLADARTLQQMGIEEQSIPDDLELNLEFATGEPRVVVRSRAPVTEPYVALVLELLVPEGLLLKEFTLLLDPPQTSIVPIGPAFRAEDSGADTRALPPDTALAAGDGAGSAEADVEVAQPEPTLEKGAAGADDGWYRMGDAPETLWRIASKHRPAPGITTQQTMIAILRMNPSAFIDGNINRLKASQTLRLPSAEEATELSAAAAFEAVQTQAAAWNGQPAAPPVNARSDLRSTLPEVVRAPVAADPVPPSTDLPAVDVSSAAATQSEGRLEIVADSAALQADNDRLVAEAEQLRSELAAARAEAALALESRDREMDALRSQVERLKEAARMTESRASSRETRASDSLIGSTVLGSVIMLLVGMGLAAGFFWWRSRSSRNASAAGLTSPIATEKEARDAKPPLAQEIAAIERSIPPPPWVQPLTSSVPEIAEAKPVVSAVGQQPVAPEPPIQETPMSPLSAADLRLEADDIDALDPDTLALEMDIPAPPIAAASAPEGDALRALEGAEFDFLDDLDSTATKLDLARAYREMGDSEGAREILKEVIEEGNAAQQQAARDLLATL